MMRFFKYHFLRILRAEDKPHKVALGFSAGVFVGASPFLGFHTIISLLLAKVLNANKLAALIGSFIYTFLLPVIYGSSYYVFRNILGYSGAIRVRELTSISEFIRLGKGFVGIILGSFIWGLILAVTNYVLIIVAVRLWKARRLRIIRKRKLTRQNQNGQV